MKRILPIPARPTALQLAIASLILGLAGPASAACSTAGLVITCDASSTQTSTVGTGSGTPTGTAVIAQPGAVIDTGSGTAISIGDGSSIDIQANAIVRNTAPGGTSGPYGTGANTVEFGSNNTVNIGVGAQVLAQGGAGDAEAINPIGSGNVITNAGTINAQGGGAAIWFQSGAGNNTVINEATGTIQYMNGGTSNAIGVQGTMAIDFVNKGQVFGSLNFADGDDTLDIYDHSSISGNIDGGGGHNTLSLNGSGNDTFTKAFSNFQSLIKNGSGSWTYGDTLPGSGITSVEVAAGTLILGTDAHTFGGSVTVDAPGTLQSSAEFAPLAITDNGLVRFEQPSDATYAGLLSGTGGIEKTGAGQLTLSTDQAISGSTTISAGTLRLGNGGTAGMVSGPIIDNAALVIDRSDATTFAAPISGSGTVTKLDASTTTFTADNSYTGLTTISAGTLQLGNGGSSGSVAGPILDNAALVINRSNAVTFAAPISGSGSVTQLGAGTTLFTADNSYTGGTTISAGTLQLGNGGSSGSVQGSILDNANLAIDRSDRFQLDASISGSGNLQQIGSGTTVLSGTNSYGGSTLVAAGTLTAASANAFSAASAHVVAAGATLDTGGFNQSVAALRNAGTVSLLGSSAGSALTVTGAYVGNNGVLSLGTVLGPTGSLSDRLVLSGPAASASGFTTLRITNLGGLGALTSGNGIEVISAIGGATSTAQSTRDAFALAGGHVDAGAYAYSLYAGDARGAGENWYLRSTLPISPLPGGDNASLNPPGGGNASVDPPVAVPSYRAEVPLFAALPAQLRQADLAMLGNLHRRVGDELAPMAGADGAQAGDSRQAWARAVYTDLDIRQDGVADAQSRGHVAGLQAGTDLLAGNGWRAGVFVGSLDGNAAVTGNAYGVVGAVGGNQLQSRYFGGYATWFGSQGLYVDSVLQGGRHNYTVQPDDALSVQGKASTLTASVETGRAFPINESWSFEPQAQLVYQHGNFDNTLISGALVRQDADGGWIGRLGLRVKGDIPTSAGRLQPYARFNVYLASAGSDVASFIGPAASTAIASGTGYTSTELAVGATLALNPTTTLYGELGQLYSAGGAARVSSSVLGSVGLRLSW